MKTISYSIISIFIFSIIGMGFTKNANTNHEILIQAVDSTVSTVSLSQSAAIITHRLEDFSSEKFDITIIPENKQIQVTLKNDWDTKSAENLLTQKGDLAFYETYNRTKLVELLKGDDKLFSLLSVSEENGNTAKIGCVPSIGVETVNNYLNTHTTDPDCIFAWSRDTDSSDVCLYALNNNMLIADSSIESVKYKLDKVSQINAIEIALKKSVIKLWADATKRNIGNAIAIVLDNIVISAPIVQNEIKGGNCMITGKFSQTEAKYIAALCNNGELPLEFKVIK